MGPGSVFVAGVARTGSPFEEPTWLSESGTPRMYSAGVAPCNAAWRARAVRATGSEDTRLVQRPDTGGATLDGSEGTSSTLALEAGPECTPSGAPR